MAIAVLFAITAWMTMAASAAAAPPQLDKVHVSEVASTTAVLEADINPQGKATGYFFQYGIADCASNPCTSVPTPEAKLPAGSSPVHVEVKIEELSAESVYHFRLLAKNGEQTTGSDHVFATLSSIFKGLPDDRAYEQASPLDKNGGDAQGRPSQVKSSIGGNDISFGSTFSMPNAVGAQALPSFLAKRGTDWITQGLLPPASFGQRAQVIGWLPDYSQTYSNVTKLGNPRTKALLRRSTSDGQTKLMTPYIAEAEYSFAGATPDGSVVFFESQVKLPPKAGGTPIPAALEGFPNLYAWDAASGEVSLAGVLNTDTVPSKGAFAGPFDWAGGIDGTSLRIGGGALSYYLQDNHVIAANGDVYFTASGTGQLYLRRNPTKPQSPLDGEGKCTDPAKACTLHVSASHKDNGIGPDGTDSAGSQPAAFQAASANGNEVFFTSPEKLTNDANTGPEQPLAKIGTGDSATGTVEDADFIPKRAVGLTVDSEYLYWADPVGGTIGRAKLDGSDEPDPSFIVPGEGECVFGVEIAPFEYEAQTLSIPSTPRYVAVDSGHVYWTNTGLRDENGKVLDGGGTIGRADIDGSPASVDPDFICGEQETAPGVFKKQISNPQGIAVNATHIFWANAAVQASVNRLISRAKTDGDEVVGEFAKTFANFTPYGLALSSTHVYYGLNDELGGNGYLERVPIGGGPGEGPFVANGSKIRGVAVDASHLYWAAQGEEAIGRADLDFGNKANKFLETEGGPVGLAADATHLYWSVNGETPINPGNDLYRYQPEGEELEDLTPLGSGNGAEVQGVVGLSADGSYLYFVANGDLDGGGPASTGDCHTAVPHGSLATMNGNCNLYLRHEGATSFIARLKAGGSTATDALDWVATPRDVFGTSGYVAKTAFLSEDGRTLLFRSKEKLTEYDNEGIPELYRFEVGDPKGIRCVSCSPSGEAVGSGPGVGSLHYPILAPRTDVLAVSSRLLSSDGDRAFFETAESLVPEDTNGADGCPVFSASPSCLDVYEWVVSEVGQCKEGGAAYSSLNAGCVYLISSGKSDFPSFFGDASVSGNDVFFFTRQQLVGQDEDELQDVYDARVGGGIASQDPLAVVPCEGIDACHGGGQPPLAEETPGTPGFFGPNDPAPKHKKHKAGKGKAKKHKHRKHGKHPRANAKRSQRPAAASSSPAGSSGTRSAPAEPAPSPPLSAGAHPNAAPQSSPAPAWAVSLTPMPSNFAVGADPQPEYLMVATNVGGAATTGEPIVLEATLPAGLKPTKAKAINRDLGAADPVCSITLQVVSCETSEPVGSGRVILAQISVEVTTADGTYDTVATLSGGGATQEVSATTPTRVQAGPLDFEFLPGFQAPLTNDDGTPTVLAGSHPAQQTVAFGFPTVNPGDGMTNAGHPRDIFVELPRGLAGSPAASPVLCTEAELITRTCPDASQVGLFDATTLVGGVGANGISTTPLYNMVPPPGKVAEIATDVAAVGIFVHVEAGVRTDSDYGVQTVTRDVLALGTQPIFSAQAQIWGDPSEETHDEIRGKCLEVEEECPVPSQDTAFLTMPSDCPGTPLGFAAHADTWEEPANQGFAEHETTYASADLAGNPVTVEDCGALDFEPTIEAKPTTNLTDSPSGLNFTLHQPQDTALGSRSPAALKDAVVRFPVGMAVNPSQAAGLGACTQEQIGFMGEGEEGELRFSKAAQSCPGSAKLGTVEVTSPALVRRNADHEVEEDPEGNPIFQPLHGAIYIAQPFANPFNSLVATYIAVEDKRTGIVAKLAGEGELDPTSGQISTRFTRNPELPLEDFNVKLFGGARGAFITPPTCSTHTTVAELTPWSAPKGAVARPESSFSLASTPVGGPCPASEAALPHAPALSVGALSPAAGKFSPLLFKLSRDDGSQRLGKIEAILPSGLSAKLAGVGICSEQAIQRAHSREAPEQGAAELADPSCPASSQIGTAVAAAGAGPTPFRTTGRVYLSGPYKGAPLSVVAIAPAVAGPFDLGAVVVRSALYLDPVTAQGRVVSDPLPQILHGVPVDLRSVSIRIDRPNFALNPTSCSEKSFGGQAISALGASAPLSQRFQVGGCQSLPYKPKLSARLFGPTNRGAHPALRSTFTAKGGTEANTRAISFTFPRSEFIDQAHFRTICTRVQFAADQCPAGSVYGHVRAFSPLLDYPLEGPVYLRSSNHKLPDAVLSLRGPAYQPIALEAAGRVDSVNGGLRVRFTNLPDAPLSKALLTAQGAKKGLFQNSTNICRGTHRATVLLEAQNGKVSDSQPKLVAQCGGKGKREKGR
jgi:hypothetical protein